MDGRTMTTLAVSAKLAWGMDIPGGFMFGCMSTRWHKVLREVWGHKARTALVVLSMAAGVFGVGMMASTRLMLLRELNSAYMAITPAHAAIRSATQQVDILQAASHVLDQVLPLPLNRQHRRNARQMTVGTLGQAQSQQRQIVDLRRRRWTQQWPQMLRQLQIQCMMVHGTLLPMQIVSP
jgi:hypothetical protein